MGFLQKLKQYTQARIGLKQSGHSLATAHFLEMRLAHANARDAVAKTWNVTETSNALHSLGENPLILASQVKDRNSYLKFPNLGRKLSTDSHSLLKSHFKSSSHPTRIALVATDGLSAQAIETHLVPFWKIAQPILASALPEVQFSWVLVPYARVAIGDDVGEIMDANVSVVFVGERPGLSSADNMGIYLTYSPKQGNSDANRNCISNIRPPTGLPYEAAAQQLVYLLSESLRLKVSGNQITSGSLLCKNEELGDGSTPNNVHTPTANT